MQLETRIEPQVLAADLLLPGQITRRVKVFNLHQNGVYLDQASLSHRIRNGLRVQIGLRIPPNSFDGYIRVDGVIHLHDQKVEVRFLDPSQDFMAMLLEYLKAQAMQNELVAECEQQQFNRQQHIDAVSRNALSADMLDMLSKLLNVMVIALEKHAERAGSDFERREFLDDAACLRRACGQDDLLRNLAEKLLRLQPIVKVGINPDVPTMVSMEQTSFWLVNIEVTEHLYQQLAVPLQQLTAILKELQIGAVHPPCDPAILVKTLEQTLIQLNLSLEGIIYSLRCISDYVQPLMRIYRKLFDVWKQLI